jgi:hypothetical protein
MVPVWIFLLITGVGLGIKWTWFHKALILLLPAFQGWSLVSPDIAANLKPSAGSVQTLVGKTLDNITHACASPHQETFKEVVGDIGYYFFLATLIVYSLFIILNVVTLFQLFPLRAGIFVAVTLVFFLLAPWLNGKDHWEAHLELAIATFIISAAAEQVREKWNIKSSKTQRQIEAFYPPLALAACTWYFMARK